MPWGKPNSKRTGCVLELEATTVWKQLARNDDNDERAQDKIRNQCFQQWSRILWLIVPHKVKDREETAMEWPESKKTKITFWTISRAVSKERNLWYADWYSDIRLLEERCKWSRLAITCSFNFKKKDRLETGW